MHDLTHKGGDNGGGMESGEAVLFMNHPKWRPFIVKVRHGPPIQL